MGFDDAERRVCSEFGARFDPPGEDLKVGLSTSVRTGRAQSMECACAPTRERPDGSFGGATTRTRLTSLSLFTFAISRESVPKSFRSSDFLLAGGSSSLAATEMSGLMRSS